MKKHSSPFVYALIVLIQLFTCAAPVWAQKASDAESYYEEGVKLAGKGQHAQAVNLYMKSAQMGYLSAQFELGNCYYNGKGVAKNHAKAVEWWTKAATNTSEERFESMYDDEGVQMEFTLKNNSPALAKYNLAYCYHAGDGVAKNRQTAVKWYREAALDGDSDAQFTLANHYYNGEVVKKNIFAAFHWWEKAAEQGHVDAKNNLALCYQNGSGVVMDLIKAGDLFCEAAQAAYASKEEALKVAQQKFDEFMELESNLSILNEAALLGHVRAQNAYASYMSCIYEDDIKEAILWWTQAAKQGHAEAKTSLQKFLQKHADANNPLAQYILGYYYSFGEVFPKNVDKGAVLMRTAAENGLAEAQAMVAYALDVSTNSTKAISYYTMAANQGYAIAQYNLGTIYHEGRSGVAQNYAKAIYWYTKAAEQGHLEAQNNLGVIYKNGEGVPKNLSQAVKYFTLAAELGETFAQTNLGFCYGEAGPNQNYTKSAYWFRKAAEKGQKEAQYKLGRCYEKGLGVAKDTNKAVYWYHKSALQGLAEAQFSMGVCYHLGYGVKVDLNKAEQYYSKASAQGYSKATSALTLLRRSK